MLLLVVGYVRLPMAALGNLSDYHSLRRQGVIYAAFTRSDASLVQRWWLRTRLRNLQAGNARPHIGVSIRWNALVVARVHSGYSVSPRGAEGKECLYLWCFGAWVPVYTYWDERA